jgi:hypothetical protein
METVFLYEELRATAAAFPFYIRATTLFGGDRQELWLKSKRCQKLLRFSRG